MTMAESRRVQLTTLSWEAPSSSDKPAPVQKSPSGVQQVQETRPGGPDPDRPAGTDTVRLVLALFEPDERSFPQFSYTELLDNKINHTKVEAPLSRFEEEDKRANDEVAALAKKFEEKYGGKPKKKKDRIQDLIDIGYGYDDEDSFIDNSEAYDEFVPASITTKFGGFYINSGVLQFRQASDSEDVPSEETLVTSKKRKLNGGRDNPKKKTCREDGEMKNDMNPKSSILSEAGLDDELKKKKKKKAVGTLSVTSMLKKFQREKEKERLRVEKAQKAAGITSTPTIPLCPADAAGGGGTGLTDPLLSLIGSTNDHALIQAANTVDFDIDLDSLLEVTEGTSSPKLVPQPATEAQLLQSKTDDHSQGQLSNTKTNSLPEGLPPGLEDNIRKLMLAAKTSEGESKLKFFTPEINSILLEIELQCREQGGQLRSKVYTHLSSFLPCSRETLLKRVKKLLLTHMEEPPDVEHPMQQLKEAIGRAMPDQIASFHENCQEYEQVKTLKATEEDKEGKVKANAGPDDNVEEKGGKRGGPKKLFRWNEEIRECFSHVIQVKLEKYKKERKGSQDIEEYLKTLLENDVKPLWPKGWMQSRVLIKESRNILSAFTSAPVKRPKLEKRQPSINGPLATSDVLQGSSSLKGLPEAADCVFIESSTSSNLMSHGSVKKEVDALKKLDSKTGGGPAVDAGSSTPADSDVAPASTHSLLDLLADQALAREKPLSISQEILAAAVAKYKRSVQHWSFGMDTKSPPLPPPPPQSSPVGFPLTGVGQTGLPKLLLIGDLTRQADAEEVVIISDEEGS